jgi:hypothetical protein
MLFDLWEGSTAKRGLQRVLCFALLGLSGCSVVEVSSAGEDALVARSFGVTRLYMQPESAPVVAKIRSFGFVESPLGISLGYSDQVIVALPPSCRVVFWIENEEQFERIKSLVDSNEFCPVLND